MNNRTQTYPTTLEVKASEIELLPKHSDLPLNCVLSVGTKLWLVFSLFLLLACLFVSCCVVVRAWAAR